MTSILLLMLISSMAGCSGGSVNTFLNSSTEESVLETQEENDFYDGSISEADIFVVRKFIQYQKFADSFNL